MSFNTIIGARLGFRCPGKQVRAITTSYHFWTSKNFQDYLVKEYIYFNGDGFSDV